MRRTRWLLLGAALAHVACGPPAPETPGEMCGRVAGIYMGLQLPVKIEFEESSGQGTVTVQYSAMDRANIPARGDATCVFADAAAPGNGVESANVNGQPLGRHEIAALNRKLASR